MITDSHPERALVPPSTFVEADLVVDEPHLRLVAAKLKDLGVTFDQEEIELSRRLGLVLIKNLQGLPDAAAKIKTAADNEKPTIVDKAGPTLAYLLAEATATATAAGSELKNLDVVLVELRRRFKAHFGRWIPEMGKNRHVVSVQAGPGGSKPNAFGDPSPVPGPGVSWPTGGGDPASRARVRVGMLDTALFKHEFLYGHLANPHPLFELVTPPLFGVLSRLSGHATFVASLIAKQAPDAEIDLRTVLKDEVPATMWQTAKGIASFIGAGIDILNLSLGCRTFDGEPPLVLTRAIERLGSSVLVVASAGNHAATAHPKVPNWPAALPDVIAVGAVDQNGRPAEFSPQLPWVTVTAPGVDVKGAYVDGKVELAKDAMKEFDGWALWSGTSFATATVTGLVAARTVPGVKSARQALEELLSHPSSSVGSYLYTP